jgi:hypothetical protein
MLTFWAHRLGRAVAAVDPRLLPESAKYGIDGISAMTAVASLAQLLPALASLLTIVWMAIRIWETPTVQGWFGRAAPKGGVDG